MLQKSYPFTQTVQSWNERQKIALTMLPVNSSSTHVSSHQVSSRGDGWWLGQSDQQPRSWAWHHKARHDHPPADHATQNHEQQAEKCTGWQRCGLPGCKWVPLQYLCWVSTINIFVTTQHIQSIYYAHIHVHVYLPWHYFMEQFKVTMMRVKIYLPLVFFKNKITAILYQ